MPSQIQVLQQKKADLKKDADKIFKAAENNEEPGVLTEDQNAQIVALTKKIEQVDQSLNAHIALAEKDFEIPAISSSDGAEAALPSIKVGEDKSMEFQSLGEMLNAVAMAGAGNPDPRLFYQHKKQAAASGLNMSTPSEGGFLIQTQFSTMLMETAVSQSQILPLCKNIPIGEGFDGLEAPYIDETSRATGSRLGGVQVYRNHEAEEVTAKKPKFGRLDLRLEEMTGLCYIGNRLLRNVSALEAIVTQGFADEFSFKIDDEIVRGSGAGECLGYLNANSLVTVAKETGQAADTIVTDNILNMDARMPTKNRGNCVWLVNSETLPQLRKLTIDVGTGGLPVYVPNNGLADEPFDRLLGRPVRVIEQASALGDVGDISLVDLTEYLVITQGALETATSLHVKFLTDEMTFRFKYLINGQPVPSSSKTPYKGAGAKSPFVTLAAR